MVESRPDLKTSPPDGKHCALQAAGHLKKASLLGTLLDQTLKHIQALLTTVIDRTKQIVKRLGLGVPVNLSSFAAALNSQSTVLQRLEGLLTHVANETVSIDAELSVAPDCLADPVFQIETKLRVNPTENIYFDYTRCLEVTPDLICL